MEVTSYLSKDLKPKVIIYLSKNDVFRSTCKHINQSSPMFCGALCSTLTVRVCGKSHIFPCHHIKLPSATLLAGLMLFKCRALPPVDKLSLVSIEFHTIR